MEGLAGTLDDEHQLGFMDTCIAELLLPRCSHRWQKRYLAAGLQPMYNCAGCWPLLGISVKTLVEQDLDVLHKESQPMVTAPHNRAS